MFPHGKQVTRFGSWLSSIESVMSTLVEFPQNHFARRSEGGGRGDPAAAARSPSLGRRLFPGESSGPDSDPGASKNGNYVNREIDLLLQYSLILSLGVIALAAGKKSVSDEVVVVIIDRIRQFATSDGQAPRRWFSQPRAPY